MITELIKRVITSLILLPTTLLVIIYGSYYFILTLLIFFLIACYEWHFMCYKKPFYIAGLIFLIFSFFTIYKTRFNTSDEYIVFLFITCICVLSDIGGYIFGKIFNGPKLTIHSPNKTYAGMLGSYIFSTCSILVLHMYNIIILPFLVNILILIFLVSSVSQIGDIIISYFKRISKIKDTGKILPGHGGLLDRIDGMIFAFPFAYLIMFSEFFNMFL